MSSLQSPSAPGEPSPARVDSFEQALAAERRSREDQRPDWPPWMAPAALVSGLILAAVGGLIVDLPAAVFGVDITSSHIPGGLEIADTVVQDVVFVLTAVLFARMGGRVVRSWQFGLRPPRMRWRRVSGLILLLLVAFIVLSAIWSAVVHPEKEKVLETLGSNGGTTLLLLSAVLTCVVAPFGEEFLFRGFIFTALRNWKGMWPAAIITGVLFGGVHLGSAPTLDLVPLMGLGFGLCLLYRYTGSLYPCFAAHSLNNSVAFGSLEGWAFWQVVVLMAASLVVIGAIVLAGKRVGLISAAPPLASAAATSPAAMVASA
jgi:membrane protease YdiL (CAAX protease family)